MSVLAFPSLYGDAGVDNLLEGDDWLRYLLEGEPSSGGTPQTVTAQPATLTLSGVAGSPSGGPVTVTAQIATLTLSGVAGSPSSSGGTPQTVTAQVATLTLSGVAGVPSIAGASVNGYVVLTMRAATVSLTTTSTAIQLLTEDGDPILNENGDPLFVDRIARGGVALSMSAPSVALTLRRNA